MFPISGRNYEVTLTHRLGQTTASHICATAISARLGDSDRWGKGHLGQYDGWDLRKNIIDVVMIIMGVMAMVIMIVAIIQH